MSSPVDEYVAAGQSLAGASQHPILAELLKLGSQGLIDRGAMRDAYLSTQGITFTLSGQERPLSVDLVPRVITAEEWELVAAGVKQRIRGLEAFLADIYGDQMILKDGIIPRQLILSSEHFHREAYGISPANGVRIHVSGIDLIRDEHGTLRVLEDNLRCPSGVSYVLENRRTLAHVVPEIFSDFKVRSIEDYPQHLLRALKAAAPVGVRNPVVAILTPGIHNSAHFEHAFLARRMGVELVEGRDLFCKNGFVYMRTTSGPEKVDVLYRRIDDEYLDPMQFAPDSVLGVPGLLNAARAGNVGIANGVGNGVADDKAVYPYVPAIIRYYLNEEPILPNVDTYDLQIESERRFVLAHLKEMVVKPVAGSGGYGLVIGNKATEEQLREIAAVINENPRGWIAQKIINLSTCPTVLDDGSIASRHIDLRPFAVNDGKEIYVLPGGLTRVALIEGSLVVNSSQGGGSKDTWVLSDLKNEQEPEKIEAPIGDTVNIPLASDPVGEKQSGPETLTDRRLKQQEEQQQQSFAKVGS
jgi:uncharacterized circularly permuted ATP-grasp superfamily protein